MDAAHYSFSMQRLAARRISLRWFNHGRSLVCRVDVQAVRRTSKVKDKVPHGSMHQRIW